MIHQMQIGDMSGSGSEIVAEAKRIEQWNERLFTTIAAHSGHTVDEIREVCERDKYFTAEEAVEFGLIDSIVPPKKQIPELKLPVPKKKK
jgi:ATP-dependent Clp protease protease subunit